MAYLGTIVRHLEDFNFHVKVLRDVPYMTEGEGTASLRKSGYRPVPWGQLAVYRMFPDSRPLPGALRRPFSAGDPYGRLAATPSFHQPELIHVDRTGDTSRRTKPRSLYVRKVSDACFRYWHTPSRRTCFRHYGL